MSIYLLSSSYPSTFYADLTDLNFKMYTTLDQIGLSADSITSINDITVAMGDNSILILGISGTNRSALYEAGVIPQNATGLLEITYRSRVKCVYNTDNNAFYTCAASNGTTATFSNWAQI